MQRERWRVKEREVESRVGIWHIRVALQLYSPRSLALYLCHFMEFCFLLPGRAYLTHAPGAQELWRAKSPQLHKAQSRVWYQACQRPKMRKLGGYLLSLHNLVWPPSGPWIGPHLLCPAPGPANIYTLAGPKGSLSALLLTKQPELVLPQVENRGRRNGEDGTERSVIPHLKEAAWGRPLWPGSLDSLCPGSFSPSGVYNTPLLF